MTPNRRVLGGLEPNRVDRFSQHNSDYSSHVSNPPNNERGSDFAKQSSCEPPDPRGPAQLHPSPSLPRPRHIMNGNNAGPDLEVGDTVGVPGGMTGVVKFIGAVQGKNGIFAGVELSKEYASRGKNDGDVEGIRYFTTTIPGAGIFLPSYRATKQQSPTLTTSSFPPTPTTPSFQNFDLNRKSKPKPRTPPTPSIPKFNQSVGAGARPAFSQSVGPGARAPSPQQKPKSRPSLPRPESPVRTQPRAQNTPSRPSLLGVRPPTGQAPAPPSKTSTPVPGRSASRSRSRQGPSAASPGEDNTPTAAIRSRVSGVSKSNARASVTDNDKERLQHQLEERDRQLKEQAASLAEMESSLAELQSLMAANNSSQTNSRSSLGAEPGAENADVTQLRALLREKSEKIQMLTAEFDSHRADFRSTIDTLEMASTETERVYEKRVQELLQEVYDLQSGREDVETVAAQLKQLEDLVQELEEGLEDARRGEAEARSEVEFLRGEVERARLELRREREKASKALAGADAAVGERERGSASKDSRDDEIRGLKAIIHSLSSGPEMGSPGTELLGNGLYDANANAASGDAEELAKLQESIAALNREKSDLKGLIERKNLREEELERENTRLRESSGRQGNFGTTLHERSDSNSTATMHTANRNSNASAKTAIRPGSTSHANFSAPINSTRLSKNSGDWSGGTRPISAKATVPTDNDPAADWRQENAVREADTSSLADSASASADTDSPWCELCETSGHDVLTCSRMFGELEKAEPLAENNGKNDEDLDRTITQTEMNGTGDYEKSNEFYDSRDQPSGDAADVSEELDAPSQPRAPEKAAPIQAPQPGPGEGAAPGKTSGVVDMTKWCAMCERDGHESVDCPFEDDYY